MAVLGMEGRVRLRREAPDPLIVSSKTLRADIDKFLVNSADYWSGDEVYVFAERGLPIRDNCSDGVAMYADGYWDKGPNRKHIENDADLFYLTGNAIEAYDNSTVVCADTGYLDYVTGDIQDSNTLKSICEYAPNYDQPAASTSPYDNADVQPRDLVNVGTADDVPFYCNNGVQSGSYFIHRDTLNRLSLHTDYCSAVNGGDNNRVDLVQYDFQTMLIAPAGTEEYNDALAQCVAAFGDYRFSDARDEVTLESICKFAPDYEKPVAGTAEYDDADLTPRRWIGGFPWVIQCQLKEWSLDLDSSAIDTSQVGDKFGENVKSIVTGGGSFDFFIGEADGCDGTSRPVDPTYLMQLLLITDKGAKADAEFRLMAPREPDICGNACSPLAQGNLFYRTQLLITKIAVNVRATDLIVGSASFATSGPIEMNVGRD